VRKAYSRRQDRWPGAPGAALPAELAMCGYHGGIAIMLPRPKAIVVPNDTVIDLPRALFKETTLQAASVRCGNSVQ
jgi:hypothetical protein